MRNIFSLLRREDIITLIGGLKKVKDGLFPRKELCQFSGLKLKKNTNSAQLLRLSICLGIGQLRLTTLKLELSANGNQLN